MVSEKTEKKWKLDTRRKQEKKETVIDFIDFLMEEYDISIEDLEV